MTLSSPSALGATLACVFYKRGGVVHIIAHRSPHSLDHFVLALSAPMSILTDGLSVEQMYAERQ